MKRLLGFIFFCVLILGLGVLQNKLQLDVLSDFDCCTLCFNSKVNVDGVESVDNGKGCIVTLKREMLVDNIDILDFGVSGITLRYSDIDVDMLLRSINLNIVSRCYMGNGYLITGYSEVFKDYIMDSEKINVQIYITNDYTLLGYPLIMEGF